MSFSVQPTIHIYVANRSGSATPILEAMQKYLENINRMMAIEWFSIDNLRLKADGEEIWLQDLSLWLNKKTLPRFERNGNRQWPADSAFGKLLQKLPHAQEAELDLSADICQRWGGDYGMHTFEALIKGLDGKLQPGDRISFRGREHYDVDALLLLSGLETDEEGHVYELELVPCDAGSHTWDSEFFAICESEFYPEEETPRKVIRTAREILDRFSDLQMSYVELNCTDSNSEDYELCKDEPNPFDWDIQVSGPGRIRADQLERVREFLQTMQDFLRPLLEEYETNVPFYSADASDPFAILFFYEEEGLIRYQAYELAEPKRD